MRSAERGSGCRSALVVECYAKSLIQMAETALSSQIRAMEQSKRKVDSTKPV